MISPRPRHIASCASLVLAVVAAAPSLALVGCNQSRLPSYHMSDGDPKQFRRYTGRPATDFIFRWNSQAFKKVSEDLDGVMTEDKVDVLTRHGRPDYLRDDIKARSDEFFDEWVYWDRNVLVQFINGELVFEGPLLDSDRYLVQYGYPARAYHQQYEVGPVRETWLYDRLIDTNNMTVSFSDGVLAFQSFQ
jgi:hypothetical protein